VNARRKPRRTLGETVTRYTLDDHLELVRECLVKCDEYDMQSEAELRTNMELIAYRLRTLEARLDGGTASRRAKDRQRYRQANPQSHRDVPLFEV
jgi:hypothetical protein